MEVCVYILLCSDDSYYVGLTRKEPEERLWEHNNKVVPGYTASRTPVEMVYVERYERIVEAIARELQLKKWTRKKKEALIRGDLKAWPIWQGGPNAHSATPSWFEALKKRTSP